MNTGCAYRGVAAKYSILSEVGRDEDATVADAAAASVYISIRIKFPARELTDTATTRVAAR